MAVILGIVLAVMIIMNGALFYVIRTAVFSTKKQVEACFVQELEDYSDFLQEKAGESREIEEKKKHLTKEIEDLEGVVLSLKTSPFYAPRPIARELFIPTARYIDNQFFDNHKIVNEMMKDMDFQEIIDRIQEQFLYQGDREEYDTACEILEFMGMELCYELCTLSTEVQKEILQIALKGTAGEILNRFVNSIPEDEAFDALKFRTYVREIKTKQDPKMYIRTGEKTMGDWDSYDDVELVHQYDKNISEGLKIIYQNQSYDFSIYRLRSKK